MSEWVRAMALSDLPAGESREVSVGGIPVALHNIDGTVYATSNVCLHRGGPLGQGMIEGRTVLCPWHAWSWDVATGENTANPELKIPTYEVKVEEGAVFVKA
ncbi:MAG TPA: Rieske (2Fe-2S) protein [Vicinamibacteria bacterium]|nr:Rieske (2Fe-2S) protein [Vicinamibacteria bacterium]